MPKPPQAVLEKIDTYMKRGGTVLFDTRDAVDAPAGIGGENRTPGMVALRAILSSLDIPELEPVPRDHVLTKTFFLLRDFPGRFTTGQLWVEALPPEGNDEIRITVPVAEESIQKKAVVYDKKGDQHYDTISAFIKSMRGSDPDAAIYYLAKMIYAGEDPRFIARRIVICASEDVGNADPNALVIAISALRAVEFVGMPEAKIPLAQATIYIAKAPKSNASYTAIEAALKDISKEETMEVPDHLKDSHYPGAEKLGRGTGYKYPHDYGGYVEA